MWKGPAHDLAGRARSPDEERHAPRRARPARARRLSERHIFRATSLPRRLIELRLPALVPAPPRRSSSATTTGALSALAVPTLAAMGYTERRAARRRPRGLGGATGRPTVQGVNVPSKVFGERVLHDLQDARDHVPRARPARWRAGEDMVIVDTRTPGGVRARLPARRVEHAGRRAGAAHRRAGEAPGADHRRPLRRPHPLLPRRRVGPAHGAAQSRRRA